jgi:hypothetical protein
MEQILGHQFSRAAGLDLSAELAGDLVTSELTVFNASDDVDIASAGAVLLGWC